jgi:hypothetical protein
MLAFRRRGLCGARGAGIRALSLQVSTDLAVRMHPTLLATACNY